MTKLELEGVPNLLAALDGISKEVAVLVDNVVMETAADIEAQVKLGIAQGPATGRTYKRRSVVHRASAPGEAPASDTGALLGSIYHEKTGDMMAETGSRMEYAAHLEFGTMKMAARPVWIPVVERVRPEFYAEIDRALGKAAT